MYTLPLPPPEVVPPDPLVLYIPDRVELGLDDGFEFLPPSYWRITLQPKCFHVDFKHVKAWPSNFNLANKIFFPSSIW